MRVFEPRGGDEDEEMPAAGNGGTDLQGGPKRIKVTARRAGGPDEVGGGWGGRAVISRRKKG